MSASRRTSRALVYSRFGLYISRDGDQSIDLNDTAHEGISYISGFAEHPQQLGDASEFPAPADYVVPVRDLATTEAPDITVPYRSSLKKFQTRWIGEWPDRFVGSVKLEKTENGVALSGTVTNGTGRDFNDVYLAYHGGADRDDDRVIYLPKWPKNTTIDLKKDLAKALFVGHEGALEAEPGHDKIISDVVGNANVKAGTGRDQHWMGFWYARAHGSISDPGVQDPGFTYVYPMVSLFDRLPPRWNVVDQNNNWTSDRSEFFRRGARMLDASTALTAGQLLILTSAPGPLPIPMDVDGSKIEGEGTTFYQFILPIDRGDVDKPTTQPSAN